MKKKELKPGHRWAVHTDWEAKGRCEKELKDWAKKKIFGILDKYNVPRKSPDQMLQYKHACDYGIPSFFTFLFTVEGRIGARTRKLQSPRVRHNGSRYHGDLVEICKAGSQKGDRWILEGYCDGETLIQRSHSDTIALVFFHTGTQQTMWEHLHMSIMVIDNKDQSFQYHVGD